MNALLQIGRRVLPIVSVMFVACYVFVHIAAGYTESINWDEFAFFARAERSLATGELLGGGKPGFGTLVVMPFVDGCRSAIDTIAAGRLLWSAFTFGLLGGLYVLLRLATHRHGADRRPAILGVAAIALVPVFLRWSIEVRTDQLGALFGIWGGVLLLASARRAYLSFLAGLLFGIGYHVTQKLIYVVLLVAIVAVADVFADKERPTLKSLAMRAAGVCVGGGAVVLFNRFVLSPLFPGPGPVSIEGAFKLFDFYRRIIGYRVYAAMLPSLMPQIALGVLMIVATVDALRRRTAHRASLMTAWAVSLGGLVVGAWHAGAFPYFWITLGLFPAAAVAFAWPGIADVLRSPKLATLVFAGSLAWLLAQAIPYDLALLQDTQAVQRESMSFIERDLPASARGFQADGALFCRRDPAPFLVYLREHVETRFSGEKSQQNIDELIAKFRARPLSFFVHTHRLASFPIPIQRFWAEHYVLYTGRVYVPGRRFRSAEGAQVPFETLAPNRFVWHAEGPRGASLQIAGRSVAPGERIDLPAGVHALRLPERIDWGLLTLALKDPPRPILESFFSLDQLSEITATKLR